MTGLSGAGKTTLAESSRLSLEQQGYAVGLIDGDVYRKTLCSDLGFSRADRVENIRRLGQIGLQLVQSNTITFIAAINPYEESREEIRRLPVTSKTLWVDCRMDVLQKRDTKGLYRRAQLPSGHPDRIDNLTGVNDPFEIPVNYDWKIETSEEEVTISADKLTNLILDVVTGLNR
jgi:adenylylsulfate kinase